MKRYFIITVLLLSACSPRDNTSQLVETNGAKRSLTQQSVQQAIAIQQKHNLFVYPELTYFLKSTNIQALVGTIIDVGGRVLYDPNYGVGNDIPFLIVNLPPEKILDPALVERLAEHEAIIQIDSKYWNTIRLQQSASGTGPSFPTSVKVPVEDVKLDVLRKRFPNKALGDGITVAVIDTGIDVTHPVFQDRVIYWADQTQETRTPLKLEKVDTTSHKVNNYDLPEALKDNESVYVANLNEEAFRSQLAPEDIAGGEKGLDINRNGSQTDSFFTVIGKMDTTLVAFIDTDADGKFSEKESTTPVIDFNDSRNKQTPAGTTGIVRFPSRSKTIAYPLLLENDAQGNPTHVSLGIDFHGHGTHVSGIIGGNGKDIVGAAPKVRFIAEKVCSGITCTDAAILRGLVDAFNNPYGLVPDVVNISLGSHQNYQQDAIDYLIRDLAAKHGTVFFISASNAGPGYRSINHLGSFGPTVQVAAHVSRNTIQSHYNLNPGETVPENNLLFFTSLGPSYTGQLRPNIAAPGSALSSTPLINEGSAMWNGTSMSSPLAAGSASALLSIARLAPEMKFLEDKRKTKLTNLKDGSDSLIGIPLAVRESLENSAVRMSQYTMASEGYGVIDINAAYDELLKLSSKLAQTDFQHVDLQLNKNLKDLRLYNRSLVVESAKPVELDFEADGELSEESRLRLQNSALLVKLEKVEVQNTDGSVQVITQKMPFGISRTGLGNQPSNEVELRLNTPAQKTFWSLRDKDKMEPGKNYVAHYTININGFRQMTVLDVVHVPLTFNTQESPVDVPSLGYKKENLVGAVVVKGQKISALAHHRYALAVTKEDSTLRVKVAFPQNYQGRLAVSVYNPDGETIATAGLIEHQGGATPIVDLTVPTMDEKSGEVATGIYEVIIHAGSGRLLSSTEYDMVLLSNRVLPSVKKVQLKSQGEANVSLKVISGESDRLDLMTTTLVPAFDLTDVPVSPNHWTYRQLNVDMPGTHSIIVRVDSENYFGRLDPVLYKKNSNGEFVPSASRIAGKNPNGDTIYGNVTLSSTDPLYIALETFDVIGESRSLVEAEKFVTLKVMVPSLIAPNLEANLTRELNDLYTLNVKAPKYEVTSTPPNVVQYLTGFVRLSFGEEMVSLPVDVLP